MRTWRILWRVLGTAAVIIAGLQGRTHADGGTLLIRQASGPFEISFFTASERPVAADADLSVLLQARGSAEAILDGIVTIRLTPPNGMALSPITAVATHRQATNKFLYAAIVHLPIAGTWHVRISVRRASDSASVECLLPVAAATPWNGLRLLIHLLIVFGTVGLFILHQYLLSRHMAHQIVVVNES